jgi:hypothetical protein
MSCRAVEGHEQAHFVDPKANAAARGAEAA